MNRLRSFVLLFSVLLLLLAFGGQLAAQDEAKATFAGGCFWCMEPPYDELDGVISTVSGYSGGDVEDPTYEEVVRGNTGHLEVVQVTYDPSVVSYEELLDVFWVNIDPVDGGGQFCDRGEQYTTAVFYHNEEQRRLAEESRENIAESNDFGMRRIQTDIRPLEEFYRAEEYHQDYYRKNPLRYNLYRTGCGRDQRLEELWGS
ncbi:MAG: peptide-methionine (S)-S-oxide reductase MsrA [Spirochaetaceae bacterium]